MLCIINKIMKSTLTYGPNKNSSKLTQQHRNLAYRVVQCQMKKGHDQYQQLLIRQKELELQLLEEETKNKIMLKNSKKERKALDNLLNQLKRIESDNQKQETFLKEYYKFLQKKLRSGSKPIILHAGLEKINEDMDKRLDDKRKQLEQGMQTLKNQTIRLANELEKLDHRKQVLKEELEITKIEKEAERSEWLRKREAKKNKAREYLEQTEFYKKQITDLQEEKAQLENEEKSLKKIRQIEQYHKKHWFGIENAIKKQFTYQARNKHYKQAIAAQYRLKIPDLEIESAKKDYQIEELAEQKENFMKKLTGIRQNLNSSMSRMSKVQSQMMSRTSTI